MWDSRTDILFRIEVNLDKRQCLDKLINMYSIPANGVLIILDSNDYKDYPNRIWTNQGLHLNIMKGGVEEMSPEYLLEIMESKRYTNLIWLSNRICCSGLTEFVWVASHEFQHFVQNTMSHRLSLANTFLYNVLGNIQIDEPKVAITIPHEFDAELSAFKTIIELFGRKEAEKFIKERPERIDQIGCLLSYDLNQQFDIIGKTINLLEKYRDQLDGYIKKSN
jgi:hypothetical protein